MFLKFHVLKVVQLRFDAGVLSMEEVRKQVRENSVGAHLKRLDTMDVASLLRWIFGRKALGPKVPPAWNCRWRASRSSTWPVR